MVSFNQKNYYSTGATVLLNSGVDLMFANSPGSCYNVYLETPYTVYSKGDY